MLSTLETIPRLQQLVTGWRGAERGQSLSDLHAECVNAAGASRLSLLPAKLLLVQGLDLDSLRTALGRRRGPESAASVEFRVSVTGRFDAALVPVGPPDEPPDRWALVVEEGLALADQVALYGHALGHLWLNDDTQRMGQLPPLDPRDGRAHHDSLGELRLIENTRRTLDRRVLEAYPLLTSLLRAPEPTVSGLDWTVFELRQGLGEAGWRGSQIEMPYEFTPGRVYLSGSTPHRGRKLRVDAVLRAEASLPIALAQTLRSGEAWEDAERRVVAYARSRLGLPFAYLVSDDKQVHEYDLTGTGEPVHRVLARVPGRDELLDRWLAALGLTDAAARDTLLYPYQLGSHKPRYYQEAAINRAVIAVLQAKRGRREPRILLTLATGTGKTKVAFQLLWKLKRTRAVRNVLFLTDRDYLLGQAMDNEFAPFGEARHRILGEAVTSRDIYFATYQAIAEDERRPGLYRSYQPNFFDLIVVDECHRGSARDDSRWHAILNYFDSAVHVGLTATPLDTEEVQTDKHFGPPIYTYSLSTGINDGFLAPYRVRRVLLGTTAEARREGLAAEGRLLTTDDGGELVVANSADLRETEADLRTQTEVIAEHLAAYLRRSDPMAKTIVFCVDQDHADRMRAALQAQCPDQVARYPDYVERIVSEEGAEGKRALGRFSTPDEKTPVLVTTSKLLSTGVDIPTCKNVVLAQPINSLVTFKQIIGRGTRLHPPDKLWFTILDYAGATRLFFDPDFDGDPELVEIEPLTPQPLPKQISEEPAALGVDPSPGPAATEGGEADRQRPSPYPLAGGEGLDPTPGPSPTVGGELDPSPSPSPTGAGELDPSPSPSPTGGGELDPQRPSPYPLPGGEGSDLTPGPAPTLGGETDPTPSPSPSGGGEAKPSAAALRGRGQRTRPTPATTIRRPDGRVFQVIGEIVLELAPDGKTLRTLSYRDYTRAALEGVVATPVELRARWLRREQRDEIEARLQEEGVNLAALAAALGQPEADPLDLLLHAAFGQPPLTRRDRADRLRREQAAFLNRHGPAAREILETVLEKYVAGEASDVSDTELLKVPPLSERGTFVELARLFSPARARDVLKELQTLLYAA